MKSTESSLLADIRLALGRESGLVLYRNSVGLAREWNPKTHTERVLHYGLHVGSADLIGCLDGLFVGLEVKTADGRLTPEQAQWAEVIRSKGGFVATVHSPDEALAAIDLARRHRTV